MVPRVRLREGRAPCAQPLPESGRREGPCGALPIFQILTSRTSAGNSFTDMASTPNAPSTIHSFLPILYAPLIDAAAIHTISQVEDSA